MTCNSDFPSYHTLMGSLLEVTTVLSHFILTLLTGPRLNVDFWAQIHYILIAMNQGLSQSGLNLNSATHPGPPWAPRPSANQRPALCVIQPMRGLGLMVPVSSTRLSSENFYFSKLIIPVIYKHHKQRLHGSSSDMSRRILNGLLIIYTHLTPQGFTFHQCETTGIQA